MIDTILEWSNLLLDPDWIMDNGGLYLVILILFIETGFFFGFFLPGDPLLFISGVLIASTRGSVEGLSEGIGSLLYWMALFIASTLVGYYVGYWFGKKFGRYLQKKGDTLLFKRKHIEMAEAFYNEKGGLAIIIARFLPIVRTFAPIVAGMVGMEMKKFSWYNAIGAFIWVISITTLGYILGNNPWVKSNLDYVVLGIVLLVTAPVVIKFFLEKKRPKKAS
ncbi:MAG TPA: VTT domain-containing protein [Candidatus Sphingobacterium stercoripullorum]|nr:VTT domain-containing protein [Candidatus Sphingobacterium stercoripullorum]